MSAQILDALLVVAVYYIVLEASYYSRAMYCPEPIVIAPLVGLVLGDLQTGLIMGAALQAVFLGVVMVGGERPTDPGVGAAITTYFVVRTGISIEASLALAYTLGVVAKSIETLMNGFKYLCIPWMQKIVLKERNMKKYSVVCHAWMGLLNFIQRYAVVFLAIAFGTEYVSQLLDAVPAWVLTGLSTSGTMLAALGMAITLNMLWDKELIGFFFIGFILLKALGLSMIQIALVAVSIALIYMFIDLKINKGLKATPTNTAEEEFDL